MSSIQHDRAKEVKRAPANEPTLANLLNEKISLGQFVRAHPVQTAAVASAALLAAGGLICALNSASEAQALARKALRADLEKSTGSIAYSIGSRIEVTTPKDLVRGVPARAFQTQGTPFNLAWISDHEIAFARQHPNGASGSVMGIQKPEENYSAYASSSLIEVLDIETATIRTLFDPYKASESFVSRFGDCRAGDKEMAQKRAEDYRSTMESSSLVRIWVDVDPAGTFIVDRFGKDPKTGTLHAEVKGVWYALKEEALTFELHPSVYVPESNQRLSPCGRFELEESSTAGLVSGFDWLEIRRNPRCSVSVPLKNGARYGAWRG